MSSLYKNVLVTGSTGKQGGEIARAFLESRHAFNVSLLVRPGSLKEDKKAARVKEFISKGAKIVEGDVEDLAGLTKALSGIDLVVSATNGPAVIQHGDDILVKAAKAAGVRRVVLNSFYIDPTSVPIDKQLPFYAQRALGPEKAKAAGVEWVFVATGQWLEALFAMISNLADHTITIPEDGNRKWSVSTIEGAARLAVEAVIQPNAANSVIRLASNTVTFNDIADALDSVSEKPWKRVYKPLAQLTQDSERETELFKKYAPILIQFATTYPSAYLYSHPYNETHKQLYEGVKLETPKEYAKRVVLSNSFPGLEGM